MANPRLVWADASCVIHKQSLLGLPLLIDRANRPVLAASNWFRYLGIGGKTGDRTLVKYAKTIRNFWEFLELSKVDWKKVSDATLTIWRNRDHVENKIKKRTCNNKLSVVYRFYIWAQQQGMIEKTIGEIDEFGQGKPQILIERVEQKSRYAKRNASKFVISSHIMYSIPKEVPKNVPTASEMDRVYAKVSENHSVSQNIRNALILSWAELAGMRRSEIISLQTQQIPDWNTINHLKIEDAVFHMEIIGKGNKARFVPVSSELLESTRDYIEIERQEIVEKFDVSHRDIFVSHTTGAKLSADYITNLIGHTFRSADVAGSLHRVRARFISRIVAQSLDDAIENDGLAFDPKLVLLHVAEVAGHANIETLTYYLNLHLKRHIRQSKAGRINDLREKELGAARALSQLTTRLAGQEVLADLAAAIASGDVEAVKAAMPKLEMKLRDMGIESGWNAVSI